MKLSKSGLAICLGVLGLALTACGGGHSHVVSERWSHDENKHWHACTAGNCDVRFDEGEHFWDAGVVTTEATCTTDGVMTYTCYTCGETRTEKIDLLGHVASDVYDFDETQHWHFCADCGIKSDVALHEWTDEEVLVEATCELDGLGKHVCAVCGYEETFVIEATGHEMKAIEANDSFHWISCTHCEEHLYEAPHNYGPWVEVPALNGRVRTCADCGYVQFLSYDLYL